MTAGEAKGQGWGPCDLQEPGRDVKGSLHQECGMWAWSSAEVPEVCVRGEDSDFICVEVTGDPTRVDVITQTEPVARTTEPRCKFQERPLKESQGQLREKLSDRSPTAQRGEMGGPSGKVSCPSMEVVWCPYKVKSRSLWTQCLDGHCQSGGYRAVSRSQTPLK